MERKPARQTTPEEEGIELRDDAWERFERTFEKVVKSPPVHRTGKPTGGDRAKPKGVDRSTAKSSR
jgi:hypothetical protein